jgi:hypothetical protein
MDSGCLVMGIGWIGVAQFLGIGWVRVLLV